eukprot:GFUD01066376.1.p1 GENE.GFUD01066376.1~~GFUD01066376.1.p1  ORF type:complete len:323 (-),score=114.50 GFUD01066376.1:6-974(-)
MNVSILSLVVMLYLLSDTTAQGSTFDIKCGVEELTEEVLRVEGKLDNVQQKVDKLDEMQLQNHELVRKVETVDEKIEEVQQQNSELVGKADSVEGQLNTVEEKMEEMQLQTRELVKKVDTVAAKMGELKQMLELLIVHTVPLWILVQRRGQYGNPANFFARSMAEYKAGFGSEEQEFWIGLDELARLTKDGKWEMQVDLVDFAGNWYTGIYHNFRVGEGPRYQLEVGEYDSGKSTLGKDVFNYHNMMAFSTKDVDQDHHSSEDCSNRGGNGGWWYKSCDHISINGENTGNNKIDDKAMNADVGEGGKWLAMKETEMKIKKII